MKVTVENFQSLAQAEVEVEGLTVVVGPSNLGKSALIRAIESVLYNRPGNGFVRVGAETARVVLDGAPNGPASVEWTKGKTANAYRIDGERHAKVGRGVPDALPAAGYRAVEVLRTTIRPQVASQFDPLFLLTESGAYVSEVLTAVTRLAQVTRAQRACEADGRKARGLASTRQDDLSAAQDKLARLAPVRRLYERLQRLREARVSLDREIAVADAVRVLAGRRAALLAVLARALPAPTVVPPDLGEAEAKAQRLAERWRAVRPLASRVLPDPVPVPPDVGEREGLAARLAAQRAQSVRVAQRALPAPVPVPMAKAEHAARVIADAAMAARDYVSALDAVRVARAAAKSTVQELEEAEGALSAAMATLGVCPLCDQPVGGRAA